ncbi:MAG TPA: hypothetical protein VJG90_04350 [Candidatus Nanoarchaeia archaeon]|nr:hypothetical protein [Candidatus Nanoarchaeia archaeon]
MTSKSFQINLVTISGIERLVLQELEAAEREHFHRIGIAAGKNLNHCFYFGWRHAKDFVKRVRAYYINLEQDDYMKRLCRIQPGSIQVEFYEIKKGGRE